MGGKCTPAWPHPVNTLMHLRTLTSIIISLRIVPVFNEASSKDRRAECKQHPSTIEKKNQANLVVCFSFRLEQLHQLCNCSLSVKKSKSAFFFPHCFVSDYYIISIKNDG